MNACSPFSLTMAHDVNPDSEALAGIHGLPWVAGCLDELVSQDSPLNCFTGSYIKINRTSSSAVSASLPIPPHFGYPILAMARPPA